MLEFTDATLVIVKVITLLFAVVFGVMWIGAFINGLIRGQEHHPTFVKFLRIVRFVTYLSGVSYVLYCIVGMVWELIVDIPHMFRDLGEMWQSGHQASIIALFVIVAGLVGISIYASKKKDTPLDRALRFIIPKLW
jgi:hypothetical protein